LRGYSIRVGEHVIGNFQFQTKSALESFTFTLPPQTGDLAPDVDLVDVVTLKHMRLSSLRGKMVCLDFWATWCTFCQEPMRKLDQAAANNIRWDERVTIVPLSIDEKPESVSRHLKDRGWTHLTHYWAGPWLSLSRNGLESAAAKAFVVEGIPATFLIGADGRILWRGHPLAQVSGKDIVDRIDDLLKPHSDVAKPSKPYSNSSALR
jgi:thiol-disulfide isomerase/thioredoxin